MASAGFLKRSNVFMVIQTIKLYGPLTKPEIVTKTGLASASIHKFINELLADNIIETEGQGVSSGGRKALLYRFNPRCKYIIGMHLSLQEISTFLFDLDLNKIASTILPIELNSPDVEKNIQIIKDQVEHIISNLDKSNIAGIGISVPGPVDYENGVVLRLVNAPNWVNIPLQFILSDRFKIPTVVDKVNTGIVLFDRWFGQSKTNNNLIHISISDGVGSGVLINGQPYRGNHNAAGEIGHITVNPKGKQCNCGNHGCVELYTSENNVLKLLQEQIEKGEPSVLKEEYAETGTLHIKSAINACLKKDPLACRIFEDAIDYLVIAMDNVLKMFGPDELLIDCYWLAHLPEMFSTMVNRLFSGNKLIDRTNVQVKMSYTENLHVKGAAMLIYDQMFGSYENSVLVN